MALAFAPEAHALTLIEHGAFGPEDAMTVADVAAAYDAEGEVPLEDVRLSLKVVKRVEVDRTDTGNDAHVEADIAGLLADSLTDDAPPFGFTPAQAARALIEAGAFGESRAVALSTVAASFDDVSVDTLRDALRAVDSTTITDPEEDGDDSTDDGDDVVYIDRAVAARLAATLYRGNVGDI